MSKFKKLLTGFLWISFLSGCIRSCSDSPDAIKYGQDACDHCHMNISDPKFAAEILTQKGRSFKFDSIGCLIQFYHDQLKQEVKTFFVADYAPPHALIDAKTAHFLDSPDMSGPMGPTPIASADLVELQKASETFKGVIKNWEDIFK